MVEPFLEGWERYDRWFQEHREIYQLELELVRELLPPGRVLEVGVGTGRFAEPLGIKWGVEPSPPMARLARERGVEVLEMRGEELEFDREWDGILLVTTICFLEDPEETLRRCYRGLKPGGGIVVGFVDRESPLGQFYYRNRHNSPFYRQAKFYSHREVEGLLKKVGFQQLECREGLYWDREGEVELNRLRLETGPCSRLGGFKVVRGWRPREG